MNKIIAAISAGLYCIAAVSASAKDANQTVPAKLICSAHSANPEQNRAYQAELVFSLNGPQLKGERHTQKNDGTNENFAGMIMPSGDIVVMGFGENKKGGKWVFQFSGNRNDAGDTELKGHMENTVGAVGGRDCSLIFMKPRAL